MSSDLPSLKALRAFEAVVRCGSVTAAAEYLGVTHGAVSKQVAQMEDWYGRRLFRRTASGICALPEAMTFASEIGQSFDRIRRASRALQSVGADDQELQVLAPATFAMQWLVPRLSGFRNPRNDAPVRVQTSQTTDNWLRFTFDVAIRRDFEPTRGYRAEAFLEERLTLVAPPAIGRELREKGLEGLADVTLLSSDTRPQELERWLRVAGLESSSRFRRQRFGHFYVLLQAMLNGFGPAVGAHACSGRRHHGRPPGNSIPRDFDSRSGLLRRGARSERGPKRCGCLCAVDRARMRGKRKRLRCLLL